MCRDEEIGDVVEAIRAKVCLWNGQKTSCQKLVRRGRRFGPVLASLGLVWLVLVALSDLEN